MNKFQLIVRREVENDANLREYKHEHITEINDYMMRKLHKP